MDKKFYEYANLLGYPTVNEVTYPHCPMGEKDPDVFLVYAENEKEAFNLAMAHVYDGKPLERFYGTHNNEKYYGEFRCVI